MDEAKRQAELLRLDRESRQNVQLLHRGKLTEGEFVSRMEAIREVAQWLMTAPRTEAGDGEEG